MRKVAVLVVVAIAILAGLLYWHKTTQASVGVLNMYQGTVTVVRGSQEITGKNGLDVRLGDIIKVGPDGRMNIVLKDGSVIRLEAGSEVVVGELIYRDNKTIQQATFNLHFGKLWSKVRPLESGSNFQVETPTVVAAVRGTSYNTEYLNGASIVYVDRQMVGVALANNRTVIQEVRERHFIRLRNSNLLEDFMAGPKPIRPELIDDWIRFNQAEDERLDGTLARPQAEPPPPPQNPRTYEPRPVPPVNLPPSLPPSSGVIRGITDVIPPPGSNHVQPPSLLSPDPPPHSVNPASPNLAPPQQQPQQQPSQPQEPQSSKPYLIITCGTPIPQGTQCEATYYNEHGTSRDATRESIWDIKAETGGTITNSGYYTPGNKSGTDVIYATHQNVMAQYYIEYTTPQPSGNNDTLTVPPQSSPSANSGSASQPPRLTSPVDLSPILNAPINLLLQ